MSTSAPSHLTEDERAALPAALAQVFEAVPPAEGDLPRHGTTKTLLHRALRYVLSDYDVNGLLGMYPMAFLATAAWEQLLRDAQRGRLLDVGAGNGDVTSALAPLFRETVVTEASWAMRRRLAARGYHVQVLDLTHDSAGVQDALGRFDVVSCLHVLDRCARPVTLVERVKERLAPHGLAVFALTLPYAPHVHDGPRTLDPDEWLPMRESRGFAPDLAAFVGETLAPAGLHVVRFTRAPYVSAGDAAYASYVLDSAVVVCRAR